MRTFLTAAFLLFLGSVFSLTARSNLRHWTEISQGFAACLIAWLVAGPVMLLAGLWMLASRGRRPLPFLLAGAAAILAGAVWIGGVLTYIIPCSGSS